MSSKKKRGAKLPYVKRHGRGFRGWYMENGRQRRGPTVATEEEAHRWAVAMRESAQRGQAGAITLRDGMDLVRREVEATGRRDGTRGWYESQFAILGRAWDLSMPLAKLDKRQVAWFVERRALHTDPASGRRVSGATIRHNLRALGRIFALAIREGLASENPVLRVRKPPVVDKPHDRMSREEVQEVLDAMRKVGADRDADVVQLLFTTGLRRTELAYVRVCDVDFRGFELRVTHGKRRPRVLPVPKAMVPLLERLLAFGADAKGKKREWAGEGKERFLIPGTTERRRATYVTRTLRRWQKELKDERLHPHAMRHSFITYLARRGVPEHIIAALAGHKISASSITQLYVGVHGPQVRAAMDCLWDDGDGSESVVA